MTALLLALTILVPARAEEREQRFKEYDARRTATLEKLAQGGGLWGATARLYLKKDVDDASRIVMDTDFSNIYWANQTEFIPLYEMFNADTGSRGKLLSCALVRAEEAPPQAAGPEAVRVGAGEGR
jgi:hypothetical protein